MYWNREITVYNKYEDTQTGVVMWHRHNLAQCFYKRTNNTVKVGDTQLQSDDVIVRIPQQPNFLPPYDWQNLPNDTLGKYLTLKPNDIIVLGNVSDDIDEYTKGKRSTDIIKKYAVMGVITIKAVNDNTVLPLPHYLIRGE